MPSITKTKLELRTGLVALGACAAVLALPAGAQEEGLTVEVSDCVDLPSPEQRLACFEAQVEAARKERGSAEPPAARGAAAPSPEPAPRVAERAAPAPSSAEPAPRAVERAAPAPQSLEPAPRTAERAAPRAEPEPAPPVAPAPVASEPAPAPPRVVEARVRPEPPAPAEQSAAPDERERMSRRERQRAERLARPDIFATIMELRETVPNSYLITLDNGQVWRQTVPMSYRLREGSEVHLYPSAWGDGYRLTDEDLRGYIQVERVR